MKKIVGVSDGGKFIYWNSIANTKMESKKIINDYLYAPFKEQIDLSVWEFKEIEITFKEGNNDNI